MNNDAKYFKLGLFVMVGVFLLVAGVVFLGAGEFFTHYVIVETATSDSVEGLDVGGAVKYMGVTIGKVSKIEMAYWKYPSKDPAVMQRVRRYIYIQMSIRRDMIRASTEGEMSTTLDAMVKNGFRVRLASSGLTGPAFLEAVTLDPTQYPATPVPWQPEHLYVPSAPAAMAEIVSSVESILNDLRGAKLSETIGDGRQFIVDANAAIKDLRTKEMGQKIVALVDESNASMKRIHEILDDPGVKQSVADLPKITAPLRATLDRIDGIVHDPKLQKTIDDLSTASAAAAPSAQEMQKALRTVNQILESRRAELEASITNLRRLLANADAMLEDAKSNPSRLLFGEPPPRLDENKKK